MTEVRLSPRLFDDLDRIIDHLRAHDASDIEARVDAVLQALEILALHPLIGRRASGSRELVIGQGTHGYVARYRYDAVADVAHVLALRAQREAGYADD